ncbi:MAG: hypothetical protein JWO51_4604 [Rhodospirillales bacterium]|jgi:hypothetical protein|nr:hypothetical protein [Rhodospirillales bacterium]
MEKSRQQHTGNHPQPGAKDAGGADRFGGTRAGAENVEPSQTGGTTRSPADADIDRVGGIRPGRGKKTSEAGGVA